MRKQGRLKDSHVHMYFIDLHIRPRKNNTCVQFFRPTLRFSIFIDSRFLAERGFLSMTPHSPFYIVTHNGNVQKAAGLTSSAYLSQWKAPYLKLSIRN